MSHQDGLGKASRCTINQINGLQVQRLVAKLNAIDKFFPKVEFSELLSSMDYTPGEANFNEKDSNGGGGKHVLQEVSIIGHLRRIQALDDKTTTAIELGAGTGRLSDRVQRSTDARLNHVLVDRRGFAENHCRDRVMRARCRVSSSLSTTSEESKIVRAVVDIGSLDVCNYIGEDKKAMCMSKHLCGPACDLALHSLSRTMIKEQILPKNERITSFPSAIATCCHYLCIWETFAGKDFWEAMGLTEEDFVVATTCSQWSSLQKKKKPKRETLVDHHDATAGQQSTPDIQVLPDLMNTIAPLARAALDAMDIVALEQESFVSSEEFEKNFTREEKASLGVKLKMLLDLSRADFCQQNGLGQNVELIRYTTRSTEDRLLLLH